MMANLESSPEVQKELLISECKEEWAIWLPLKHRVERTAGLDRQLTNEYGVSYNIMDKLLEKVFAANVKLEAVGHEQAA